MSLEQKIEENNTISRRNFLKLLGTTILCLSSASLYLNPEISEAKTSASKKRKLKIRKHYSKKNKSRPTRPYSDYIILHTTEGNNNGINHITRYGSVHYMIDEFGGVYRILDDNKLGRHAGRSMWRGHANLDKYSVGIEIVGYASRNINNYQQNSLSLLLEELQRKFKIPDQRVLTHSMVAYGVPNRFHSYRHRGRKRCAMLLALQENRVKLGLYSRPVFDPDVRAGRLRNADLNLATILYGHTRDVRTAISATYSTTQELEGFREIGKHGDTAWSLAGQDYKSKTTIYFFNEGIVRMGDELDMSKLDHLPKGTKVLVGYIYGGHIYKDRSAYEVVGKEWNYNSTYYRFPDGSLKTGDDIDSKIIPKGTLVLFRD